MIPHDNSRPHQMTQTTCVSLSSKAEGGKEDLSVGEQEDVSRSCQREPENVLSGLGVHKSKSVEFPKLGKGGKGKEKDYKTQIGRTADDIRRLLKVLSLNSPPSWSLASVPSAPPSPTHSTASKKLQENASETAVSITAAQEDKPPPSKVPSDVQQPDSASSEVRNDVLITPNGPSPLDPIPTFPIAAIGAERAILRQRSSTARRDAYNEGGPTKKEGKVATPTSSHDSHSVAGFEDPSTPVQTAAERLASQDVRSIWSDPDYEQPQYQGVPNPPYDENRATRRTVGYGRPSSMSANTRSTLTLNDQHSTGPHEEGYQTHQYTSLIQHYRSSNLPIRGGPHATTYTPTSRLPDNRDQMQSALGHRLLTDGQNRYQAFASQEQHMGQEASQGLGFPLSSGRSNEDAMSIDNGFSLRPRRMTSPDPPTSHLTNFGAQDLPMMSSWPAPRPIHRYGHSQLEGDWICSRLGCGYMNFQRNFECRQCSHPNPAYFDGHLSAHHRASAPAATGMLPALPFAANNIPLGSIGDWVCECGFINWRRRALCKNCFPLHPSNHDMMARNRSPHSYPSQDGLYEVRNDGRRHLPPLDLFGRGGSTGQAEEGAGRVSRYAQIEKLNNAFEAEGGSESRRFEGASVSSSQPGGFPRLATSSKQDQTAGHHGVHVGEDAWGGGVQSHSGLVGDNGIYSRGCDDEEANGGGSMRSWQGW